MIWGLVGLAWIAVLALSQIKSTNTSEGFYTAHLLLLCYLALVLFILRSGSAVDVRNSALLMYGVTYIVFHFGIVLVYSIAPGQLEEVGYGLIWWYHDFRPVMSAYYSAAVFLAGFITVLLLPIKNIYSTVHRGHSRAKLSGLAFPGLILSILVWMALVLSAGFGAYDVLLEMLINNGNAGLIGVIHTSIGLMFIFSVVDPSTRRRAILVYGLWSLLAFPTGLRGEVAFPAVMAFAILANQGLVRINMMGIIAGSILFFLLSSAVAVTRISTSDASFLGSVSAIKGIAELGGSIRPSYEVMRWLETGDGLRLGETYYAPFERIFLRIFPLWERLPVEQDFRLMNVLISERAGPYGFSISAEAFYNFGYVGAAAVGFLAGIVLRFLGKASSITPVFLTVLAFALFIHIRQDFVTAWAAMVFGLLIIGSLKLVRI